MKKSQLKQIIREEIKTLMPTINEESRRPTGSGPAGDIGQRTWEVGLQWTSMIDFYAGKRDYMEGQENMAMVLAKSSKALKELMKQIHKELESATGTRYKANPVTIWAKSSGGPAVGNDREALDLSVLWNNLSTGFGIISSHLSRMNDSFIKLLEQWRNLINNLTKIMKKNPEPFGSKPPKRKDWGPIGTTGLRSPQDEPKLQSPWE